MSVLVFAEIEYRLSEEELGEYDPPLTTAAVESALQSALGFTGVVVAEVIDFQENQDLRL